ncbi:MAG: hypothetical protein IKV57_04865 [Clostridia bacterium]|nr:hypothetical protein [Clostridia bacterium]
MKSPIFSDADLLVYTELRWAEKQRFLSPEQMIYYMQFRLWKAPEDTAWVVLLNQRGYYAGSVKLTEGMLQKVNLLSSVMQERLNGASAFFIGHTHADKKVDPSPEDINTSRILKARFPEKPKFLGQIIVNHHMESIYLQP